MNEESEPLLRDEDGVPINRELQESPVRSSRIHHDKFTLLEKVLFTLAIVFFISLCILAGLYTRRVYEEDPKEPPSSVPVPPKNNITAVSVFDACERNVY